MFKFLIVLVAAILPSDPPEFALEEKIDLVELNHNYDELGRLQFNQIIYYNWSDENRRFDVIAWRLYKEPGQVPYKNWKTGTFDSIWHDGDQLRITSAELFTETWTQYDPEMRERKYLPKDRRLGLLRRHAPGRSLQPTPANPAVPFRLR